MSVFVVSVGNAAAVEILFLMAELLEKVQLVGLDFPGESKQIFWEFL